MPLPNSYKPSQRPDGWVYSRNSPLRPDYVGAKVGRHNPWRNPCPRCGASRYERCFRWSGSGAGRFMLILDNIHDVRPIG